MLAVQVPTEAAQKAIDEAYVALPEKPKLMALPASLGVPQGKHLVVVLTGLDTDIRQKTLVDLMLAGDLRQSSVLVPYVTTGRSSTPFTASLVSYLAGTDTTANKLLAAIIPALVATTTGGLLSLLGTFLPVDAPYQLDTTGPDGRQIYSSGTKWSLVPNPISGPGVYPQAFDVQFSPEAAPKYPFAELKKVSTRHIRAI